MNAVYRIKFGRTLHPIFGKNPVHGEIYRAELVGKAANRINALKERISQSVHAEIFRNEKRFDDDDFMSELVSRAEHTAISIVKFGFRSDTGRRSAHRRVVDAAEDRNYVGADIFAFRTKAL